MLVCYLDDSGTEKARPYVTSAGYVAFLESWDLFEQLARPYLDRHNVSCVHAKEFYDHDGDFKDWPTERRLEFLDGLYEILRPRVQMGVSVSCLKSEHQASKARTGLGKNQSPFGFAFVAAMNAILRDDTLGQIARWEGISFILEDGNKNNSGVIQSYEAIKKQRKADSSNPFP